MIRKFRAYFEQYERIVEGIGIVNPNMILVDFNNGGNFESIFINNKIHVMQSTGLKDKNGKEIYEEDVVRYKNVETFDDFPINEILKIKYSDEFLKWVTVDKNGLLDDLYDFTDVRGLEVIGNIYENEELLNDL